MPAWSVEDTQQRVAASPSRELLARRAELSRRVEKIRSGCGMGRTPLDDGADFELDAIGLELRTRTSMGETI